jgi:subtilisin family serine protease
LLIAMPLFTRQGRARALAVGTSLVALLCLAQLVAVGGPRGDALRRPALEPTDPQLTSEWRWPLTRLGLPAAWDVTTGASPGPLIAIVDTGVVTTSDLAGRVESGRSFVGGSASADDAGHGTQVAGLVAGRGNDGSGVVGVCWTCRILPLRVSAGPEGFAGSENVAAAIDEAVRLGAVAINLSLGSRLHSEVERDAVARAVAAGVVVVASAGNGSASTPSFPAAYAGVLSVGAAGPDGTLASFSNHGSWVAVLAPACGAALDVKGVPSWFCGTSAAAPFVSGVVGLVKSVVPSAGGARIVAAIERSAHAADGSAFGNVDVAGALREIRSDATATGPRRTLVHLVARPAVAGAPVPGGVLTATTGSWSGPVTSLTVRWERCTRSGRACVSVARGKTVLRVRTRDAGKALRLVVRAVGEDDLAVQAASRLVAVRLR